MDFLNRTFKHRFFTCQMLGLVISREGYFNVNCFAYAGANQTFFKAWNKGIGAKFQHMVARTAAVKGNPVNPAGKVDKHDIAHLGFTCFFNLLGRPVFVGQPGHGLVNFIIICRQGWTLYRDSCQIRDVDLRHHLNHQLGDQILTIFIGNDIQTGLAGQLEFIFFYRFTSAIIQLAANNLALNLIAKTGFDHSHWHFTRTKARHICGFRHFFEARGDFAVQFLRGQFQFIFARQTVLACFVDIHDFSDVLIADVTAAC